MRTYSMIKRCLRIKISFNNNTIFLFDERESVIWKIRWFRHSEIEYTKISDRILRQLIDSTKRAFWINKLKFDNRKSTECFESNDSPYDNTMDRKKSNEEQGEDRENQRPEIIITIRTKIQKIIITSTKMTNHTTI